MDINRMRLGLVYIFKENKKITKQTKLQLINFIEGADLHQLKVLALDGEIIPSDKLDEQSKQIVDDRFNSSETVVESLKKASLKAIRMLGEIGPVAGAAIGATVAAIHRHKYCKEKYGNNEAKRKKCLNDRSM
jgi:hypothetical protein